MDHNDLMLSTSPWLSPSYITHTAWPTAYEYNMNNIKTVFSTRFSQFSNKEKISKIGKHWICSLVSLEKMNNALKNNERLKNKDTFTSVFSNSTPLWVSNTINYNTKSLFYILRMWDEKMQPLNFRHFYVLFTAINNTLSIWWLLRTLQFSMTLFYCCLERKRWFLPICF